MVRTNWVHSVWENVYGFDMRCIQKIALEEPLVDTVDGSSLVTKPVVFKDIDLKTVRAEDLAFSSSVVLPAVRDDYIHAFVAHFDVYFNACHKRVHMSTGTSGCLMFCVQASTDSL